MRTLGHIPHDYLMITLMQHGRYLLKLEHQDVEIVYRFREGEGVHDLRSAEAVLRGGLLAEAEHTLRSLAESRSRYVRREARQTPDQLPEII